MALKVGRVKDFAITVLKPYYLRPDDGMQGAIKMFKIAWRHLWTNP